MIFDCNVLSFTQMKEGTNHVWTITENSRFFKNKYVPYIYDVNAIFSANKPKMKENSGMADDDVLGDNFPYAVMKAGYFKWIW